LRAGANDVGVFHNAAETCLGSWSIRLRPSARCADMPGVSFQSRALAVTHKAASSNEPDSISTMRGIDGTSRDNHPPPGVTDALQVSSHSVEPMLANRSRNLFSHDDIGPSGTDEVEKVGP
jgi:hypothetical protein